MKTNSLFTLLLVLFSFMSVSCSNGDSSNWMEGYWVDDDSSSYLFVNNDKIYFAYSPSENNEKLDYSHVKALFDKQSFEPWEIYEIGNALGVGGYDDEVYYRETIGVKDINMIKAIDEYVTESEWREITRYLKEKTQNLPSHEFHYLGSVQCGVDECFLFSEIEKKILVKLDCELEYGDMSAPKFYSKIEPTGGEK